MSQVSPPSHSVNPEAVYDRVTESWRSLLGEDLHYGYFHDPEQPLSEATAQLTQLMAEHALLQPGLEVLDVGCGIGNPARYLARQHGCKVTGISTSAVGLARATATSAAENLSDRVSFFERDGMANGFPDASFDRVWIMESSHLMPRKSDLLRESARVLRPGGRVILCDIILRAEIPLPVLVKNLDAFRTLDVVFGKAKMESLDTYQKHAEASGFVADYREDISDPTFPTFEHWRRNAHSNRAHVISLVGETYWTQFTQACDYLAGLWKRNLLGYGIWGARKV